MNWAATLRQNQLRQLILTHFREALRNRRGMSAMLVTFGGMSLGLAALDLLIAWNTGTQSSGVIMGAGILASSLPLLAVIGFTTLALVSTAVPLTTYRANGILRQLGTTPVSRSRFIVAHLPVRLILGLAQIVVLLTLAALSRPLTLTTLWRASVLMLSALLFLLAIGYLIGAHSQDPDRILAFSYMLIIVLIATSGTALPLEVLPGSVGSILGWLPTTLFAQSLSSELLDRAPAFLPFWATALLLFGFALVLLTLSSRSFRWDSARV